MNKEEAEKIRDHALLAIENLSQTLNLAQDSLTTEDFEVFKKGVGMSIVKVDSDVLDFIYKKFPELDHISLD